MNGLHSVRMEVLECIKKSMLAYLRDLHKSCSRSATEIIQTVLNLGLKIEN